MDKCREEARNAYREWIKREYPALLENQGETLMMCMGFAENGFVAAWQHQQAKVEELQKRVDAVKQLIQDYHQHSYREADDFVFYLEQALKGEVE